MNKRVFEYYYTESDQDLRGLKPKVFKGYYSTWDDAYRSLNKFLNEEYAFNGYLDIVYQYEEAAE